MKIAIVCYPTYGGSSVIATELGIALASRGHQVHFISYDIPVRMKETHQNITVHKVNVAPYPLFKFPPYTMALASKIADVINTQQLDIVHVHYAIPHSTSAFLAKQIAKYPHTKIITTLHGTDVELVGMDPSYRDITSFSINQSDHVTAVSDYLRRVTIELFSVEKAITVLPNFVDTKLFAPVAASLKPDLPRVLHISNFRPVKRIKDTIQCFYYMQQRIPCTLMLGGDGPDMPVAKQLVLELGIADKVEFVGYSDNIHHLIAKSHLFLLTSQTESFGLAALEALSMGVPVLSTKVGGIPEVVTDGVSGLLETPDHLDRLAERGANLLLSSKDYQQMSLNARESVLQRFTAEQVVQTYIDLYQQTLAGATAI